VSALKPGNWVTRFVTQARVGHLATSTKTGRPHAVPVCFAFDGRALYTAIDNKPKRIAPEKLRRVRNIMENPNVCVVVDCYDEDWKKLRYVILSGRAEILQKGREHQHAISLLRKKYSQYRKMNLHSRPVIRIVPRKVVVWKYQ
jgi:PPOX class probable F420-dependent enzyme